MAAGEDPAPATVEGAPDETLILPVKPIRDVNYSFPLSLLRNDGRRKGDPTPQGRAAPGTPTGSAPLDVQTEPSEMTSGLGVLSVLNMSVPNLQAYSCPSNKGPSS